MERKKDADIDADAAIGGWWRCSGKKNCISK